MVNDMTRHWRLPAVCILAVLFLASPAFRLEARGTGQIQGVVNSALGTPLANVEIIVDNPVTGGTWRTHTDAKGHYVLDKLNPGRYELQAEAKGSGCVIISQIIVEENNKVTEDIKFMAQPPPACEPARSTKGKKTT